MRSDRQLTAWARRQRELYHSGLLSSYRISRLEARGFSWDRASSQELGADRDELFDIKFNDLKDWLEEHGDYPKSCRKDSKREASLSQWVVHIRSCRAGTGDRSSLSPYRVAKLESLPGWCWDVNKKRWGLAFSALKSWLSVHSRYPLTSGMGHEAMLSRWVSKQRLAKKNESLGVSGGGHPAVLSQEQVSQLQGLPHWKWTDSEVTLSIKKDELIKFIVSSGRFPRIRAPDKKERLLSRWVEERIVEHNGGRRRSSYASQECWAELESVPGWKWDKSILGIKSTHGHSRGKRNHTTGTPGVSKEERWNLLFLKVKSYIEAAGKYPSQASKDAVERAYHSWITRQKSMYKIGDLSPDRAQKLASIKGWVWEGWVAKSALPASLPSESVLGGYEKRQATDNLG